MEEEVVIDDMGLEQENGKAHGRTFVMPSPEVDKHEMFEGKNIHSSPVDGKPLCSFSQKMCMQRRLNGFAFCIRHILEDRHAPFKQCQFVTKYNGNQCINPVPLGEERIYCNSHLQVLGLAPKKTKKKPLSLEGVLDENLSQSVDMEIEQQTKVAEQQPKPKTKSQSNKNNLGKNGGIIERPYYFGTPSAWTSHQLVVSHCLKKQSAATSEKFAGNVTFKRVEDFKKSFEVCKQKWLLKRYMFQAADEDEGLSSHPLYQAAFECPSANPPTVGHSPSSIAESLSQRRKELLLQLKHQRAQLKLFVREKLAGKDLSYSVMAKLVSAAKENPAATANVLLGKAESKLFRVRKLRREVIKCTCTDPDKTCGLLPLPYSMFCVEHIGHDKQQVLFGTCTAKFPAGACCSVPVVDFMNERPLCQEHARKRAESIEKSAPRTPPKRVRKTTGEEQEEEEKEKALKPNVAKKNLKNKLQRKFAIPVKPGKKTGFAGKKVSAPETMQKEYGAGSIPIREMGPVTLNLDAEKRSEMRNRRREKLREIAQREAQSKLAASSIGKDLESRLPRRNDSLGGSATSPFDIQEDSLSSPSISPSPSYEMDEMATEYSRGSLLGIDCNHTDSFDPDDDEMHLQLSKTSRFTNNSTGHLTRQLTSPTLNQLSNFDRKGSIGTLTSPKRFHFASSSSLSPQSRRLSSPLKLEGTDLPFSSSITSVPHHSDGLGAESGVSTPSSLASAGEDDRYPLDGEAEARLSHSRLRVISPPREYGNGRTSLGKGNWSAKFTLPTKGEVSLPSGFIRMSPLSSSSPSNASLYSPPFGFSGSPRSKTQVFKFDSAGNFHTSTENYTTPGTLQFSSAKDSVFVPIQERLVMTDKRAEKEPPIERVNPDIFFSPAAFSSTPTSAS